MKLGERVLLLDKEGKSYLVKIQEREFHTNKGVVDLREVIDKNPGEKVESHLGNPFTVLKPSILDHLDRIERGPQIVLPKDGAQIIANTGIGSGDRVLDAGVGSGALTTFFGNIVGPRGKVYGYDNRKDSIEITRKNVKALGLEDIIELKKGDVYSNIDESDLDLVSLDLPNPEKALPQAEKALKPGGYLSIYTPCAEHLQRLYSEFSKHRFQEHKTIECLIREIKVGEKCTRPKHEMLAHTGYLTFSRRI